MGQEDSVTHMHCARLRACDVPLSLWMGEHTEPPLKCGWMKREETAGSVLSLSGVFFFKDSM